MSKNKKSDPKTDDQPGYMVLARKYRPANFNELIGQDAMVQTLANAFRLGRIAQGFMLTGVRGVGKTTTARILARALNFEPEGSKTEDSEPTIDMPSLGVHCEAIMESRHVDVLEMDAASHTGVDDIREIIESTRYKPISARYKVYIIDEVHMLSKSAFNALLKTLEEPPEHVKFIFATTEVQKVPVTVLSRCQRFDLKRVDIDHLIKHFSSIAQSEGAKVDKEALALIAQAAEGSVRDGLSILDQAIAHSSGKEGRDKVTGDDVRAMLGLADRLRVFDLLTNILKGEAASALQQCEELFIDGAEPVRILMDLCETVHILTRRKIVDDAGDDALSEAERERVAQMAAELSLSVLSRCWQMLIKGLAECTKAPDQMAAVEMIVIRIAYAADLPSPEELAKAISDDHEPAGNQGSPNSENAGGPQARQTRTTRSLDPVDHSGPTATAVKKQPDTFYEEGSPPISSFEDVADLIGREGGLVLKIAFEENVRPVSFTKGAVEIALADGAPRGLANDIKRVLHKTTGENWVVAVCDSPGNETLAEKKAREHQSELDAIKQHPLVKAALKQIPEARITDIRAINNKKENAE